MRVEDRGWRMANRRLRVNTEARDSELPIQDQRLTKKDWCPKSKICTMKNID